MMKINRKLSLSLSLGILLGACTPLHTPSSMNSSPARLSKEMIVEQIPMTMVTEAKLIDIADEYRKNATGPLELALSYDPRSKSYTAMSAVNDLKDIKASLHKKGIRDISTQTLSVTNAKPLLMINYDTVSALGPANCDQMPGLNDNETGRFIGEYKFGCSTETLLAKQIARPSDLEGNDQMSGRAARREAVVVEGQSSGVRNTPIQGVERDMIQSN